MNNTQLSFKTKPFMLVALMAFLMLLTRGSHVLTQVSLPDASLALLLIGGLYLRKAIWFGFFIVLATLIDFGVATVDSIQAFCLTPGYWGMLPTYAVMWLGGVWLSTQTNLNVFKFSLVSLLATFLAFVISTQTYYLFSGRFPAEGVINALQHGWEYLPSYAGFSLMYLAIFWLSAQGLAKLGLKSPTANITQ